MLSIVGKDKRRILSQKQALEVWLYVYGLHLSNLLVSPTTRV